MRVALLSDTHGNLPALEAALRQIRAESCDMIVHAGDMVAIGPFSGECIDLARTLDNLHAVRGNHERYLSDGIPDPKPEYITDGEVEHHRWLTAVLTGEQLAWLDRLPYQILLDIGRRQVSVLHCLLADDRRDFTIPKEATPASLDRYFQAVGGDVIVFGHTHRRADVTGRARYINPGSLGCHSLSVARFLIVDFNRSGVDIRGLEAEYDGRQVLSELRRRQVPDREVIERTFFQTA